MDAGEGMERGRRAPRGAITRCAGGVGLALALALAGSSASAETTSVDLGGGVRLELVTLPPGTFVQGSKVTDAGHQADENERQVRITKELLFGVKPVTRGQFRRFVDATHYKTEAEGGTSGGFGWDGSKLVQKPEYTWQTPGFVQTEDDPVVLVTFGDANKFIAWASERAASQGLRLRLPTEAEWEYAAHGGRVALFPWGDDPKQAESFAHFAQTQRGGTRPSGVVSGNGFGLFDMAGNVWQWTSDFHGPITAGAATDPAVASPITWELSDKPRRVLKGGSWLTTDRMKLRPAQRNRATEGSRNADFGFRVVAERGAAPVVTPPPSGTSSTPRPATDRSDKPGPSSSGLASLFALLLGGGLVGGVAWLVLRGRGGRGAEKTHRVGGGLGPYRTRGARDGFIIEAPTAARGRVVSYVAYVAGRSFRGRTTLSGSPQGTFVYTGSPPEDITLGDESGATFPAGQGSSSSSLYDATSSSTYDSSSSNTYDAGSSGSGWPSAY